MTEEKKTRIVELNCISDEMKKKSRDFYLKFHSLDQMFYKELMESGNLDAFDELGVVHEFGSFDSKSANRKIGFRCIKPKNGECKGRLLFLHGLGSSSTFSIHRLARFALDDKLEVYSYCAPNHGTTFDFSKFMYPRGYIENFQKDLCELAVECYDKFLSKSTLPKYMVGGSMGGLTILLALLNHSRGKEIQKSLSGIVLEAPALEIPAPNLSSWKGTLVSWGCKAFPRFRPFFYDPIRGCSNLEGGTIFGKHPDTQNSAPLQSILQIIQAVEELNDSLSKGFDCPMLIIHGFLDKTTEMNGSERIFKANRSPCKWFLKLGETKHLLSLEFALDYIHQIASEFFESLQQNTKQL